MKNLLLCCSGAFLIAMSSFGQVPLHVFIICSSNGVPAASGANVATFLPTVNAIFGQVAMEFYIASTTVITNGAWFTMPARSDGFATYQAMQSYASGTGGLELYCIQAISDRSGTIRGLNLSAGKVSDGLTITAQANAYTLAHELGHACNLRDIYDFRPARSGNPAVDIGTEGPKEVWMPKDWGGGYYRQGITQKEIVQKLLMYGYTSDTKADIPLGQIHGINAAGATGLVSVGLTPAMNREPKHY